MRNKQIIYCVTQYCSSSTDILTLALIIFIFFFPFFLLDHFLGGYCPGSRNNNFHLRRIFSQYNFKTFEIRFFKTYGFFNFRSFEFHFQGISNSLGQLFFI